MIISPDIDFFAQELHDRNLDNGTVLIRAFTEDYLQFQLDVATGKRNFMDTHDEWPIGILCKVNQEQMLRIIGILKDGDELESTDVSSADGKVTA